MSLLVNAIYLFLKILVYLSCRIFYSKITIINKEYLSFKNPAIVISNHPSTLMDPLNVGLQLKRRISFLANAGLFGNPAFGAFLKIYCIPVERPKDVDGRRINNADSFARADEHLAENGCIYIAAEGTSVVERRLRPLKTGTARIALSAEGKKDFKLGVTVLPVGLTYSSPLEFRSEVLLNVGAPVQVNTYEEKYLENNFQAAKELTTDLQSQMQSLIFHTEDDAMDTLLSQIQTVLQSNKTLAAKEHFLRSQEVLQKLKTLAAKDLDQLKLSGEQYFTQLKTVKLSDLNLSHILQKRGSLPDFLKLILGLPFFLYGWINNFLAFFIPGFIAHKLKIFHGYIPTVKALAGLIFIPLFFYIQTKLVSHYVDFPYIGWIYLLSLLPMGWLAWEYRNVAIRFFKDRKVRQFKNQSNEAFERLVAQRNNFVKLIDQLKMVATS